MHACMPLTLNLPPSPPFLQTAAFTAVATSSVSDAEAPSIPQVVAAPPMIQRPATRATGANSAVPAPPLERRRSTQPPGPDRDQGEWWPLIAGGGKKG